MDGYEKVLLRNYNEKYMNEMTVIGLGQTWKGCVLVLLALSVNPTSFYHPPCTMGAACWELNFPRPLIKNFLFQTPPTIDTHKKAEGKELKFILSPEWCWQPGLLD